LSRFIKYHKHLLDSALWLICIASVAALFLAHEDPFARDALCSHTKICPVIETQKHGTKFFMIWLLAHWSACCFISSLSVCRIIRSDNGSKRA